MSPWTVREWQGCLIFEWNDTVWRIPAGAIFGVRTGGCITVRWTIGTVFLELDLRFVQIFSGTHAEALRVRDEILAAIRPYWQTGPQDKPEPGTVTSLHRVDI